MWIALPGHSPSWAGGRAGTGSRSHEGTLLLASSQVPAQPTFSYSPGPLGSGASHSGLESPTSGLPLPDRPLCMETPSQVTKAVVLNLPNAVTL